MRNKSCNVIGRAGKESSQHDSSWWRGHHPGRKKKAEAGKERPYILKKERPGGKVGRRELQQQTQQHQEIPKGGSDQVLGRVRRCGSQTGAQGNLRGGKNQKKRGEDLTATSSNNLKKGDYVRKKAKGEFHPKRKNTQE